MIYDLLEIAVRALICVLAVIALTRIVGLRSFSKMSGFDFAITVATGSVLASTVTAPKPTIAYGLMALVALFTVQTLVARLRHSSKRARQLIDNDPLLIMKNGEILEHNLQKSKLTKADLYGKLREANAYDLSRVLAVVFEPTGDVSVLHGSGDPGENISPEVLAGVHE